MSAAENVYDGDWQPDAWWTTTNYGEAAPGVLTPVSRLLWATGGENCWSTVQALAERGILVAPGEFYGPTGGQHVRVALTATDERVAAAVARLG